MAPTLKLTYFPIGGRADPVRWALFIGGINFEDHHVSHSELASLKPSLPFGQLPVLEVDGVTYSQSTSMLRYAGKLAGLYPTDALAAFKVDELLDAAEDVINFIVPSMRETNEEKRAELRKKLASETLPPFLAALEKLLERNGSSPFGLGSEISVGDLKLANVLVWLKSGTLSDIPADIAESYPRLVALREAVLNHPKVKEWSEAHKQ